MINKKILLMTFISLTTHMAVAATLVFYSNKMSGNSFAVKSDNVIWGYIEGDSKPQHNDATRKTTWMINKRSSDRLKSHQGINKNDTALVRQDEFVSVSLPHPIDETSIRQEDVQHTETGPSIQSVDNENAGNLLEVKINLNEQMTYYDISHRLADDPNKQMEVCNPDLDCGADSIIDGKSGNDTSDIIAFTKYIRNEIERYKYYPDIARSKGIEGTVYINFHIGEDGIPTRIRLEQSSGSKILDEAGIKTVGMIGKISSQNKYYQELDIVVPITFRLDKLTLKQ